MWTDVERYPETDWSSIQFGDLKTRGMLFKGKDLQKIAEFLGTFRDELPTDWLMDYFYALRRRQSQLLIRPKWLLFQHIGHRSSLEGKIGILFDNRIDEVSLHNRLWQHKETRAISKILSWSEARAKNTKFQARQTLKRIKNAYLS